MHGAPRIDWTGKRFVNGSTVLRCEGRLTVGLRTLPRWVIQCACGDLYERTSSAVGTAMRGDRASRCDECARRFLVHQTRCRASQARIARRRRERASEKNRLRWAAWHAIHGEERNVRRRNARRLAA